MHKLNIKTIFLTVTLLWATQAAVADDENPNHFGMGIQAGLTFSSFSNGSGFTVNNRTGWLAGILFDVPLVDGLFFSPELNYYQRGANLVDSTGFSVNAYSDALEVPLFVKLKLLDKVRPYLFLGPNFIFNISNAIDAIAGTGNQTSFNFQASDIDVAADFGAGVEIGPVLANVRYSLGITNASKTNVSWNSRGFKVLVGLHF